MRVGRDRFSQRGFRKEKQQHNHDDGDYAKRRDRSTNKVTLRHVTHKFQGRTGHLGSFSKVRMHHRMQYVIRYI